MTENGGGLEVAAEFRAIWFADFEYARDDNGRPWVVCMVARELRTGQSFRLWRDELLKLDRAPFDVGPDALFVAYAAWAELGCFLVLGWSFPVNVLDLFVEHRAVTNGLRLLAGNSLLGALAYRGLAHIDAGEKQRMRDLVMNQQHWTDSERVEIFDYCDSDVRGLAALFMAMVPTMDWPRALLRGRYAAAVARIEHVGIPVDAALHHRLSARWEPVKQRLIADVDAGFGVYEHTTFKTSRFERWLVEHGVEWPRLPSGALSLNDSTFRSQALRHPQVQSLRELRNTLGKMRLTGIGVGQDGWVRCSLRPFMSKTGRNQPSNSEFLFGPAKWMRALIKPPEGWALAYIDWHAQEIAIAAKLSADERLIEAYSSGDPYMSFGRTVGLAPIDATAFSHPLVRDRCSW